MAEEPGRLRRLAVVSAPFAFAIISQSAINLVDTAMVGRLGTGALAAVGAGSVIFNIPMAFFWGGAFAVQAMTARRKGQGKTDLAVPLNGALLAVLAVGVPLALLLILFARPIFALVNGDPAVLDQGVPYLQARFAGLVAVGVNFAFRGYWTGISRPRCTSTRSSRPTSVTSCSTGC